MIIKKVFAILSNTVEDPLESRFEGAGSIFGFAGNVIIGVGWALVFVMLGLGLVQMVLSKGEKTAVDSAKKWLTYAVIGGLGLFFAMFIRMAIPRLMGRDTGPVQNDPFEIDIDDGHRDIPGEPDLPPPVI